MLKLINTSTLHTDSIGSVPITLRTPLSQSYSILFQVCVCTYTLFPSSRAISLDRKELWMSID